MSERYNEYIREHRANVIKAFEWMKENLFSEFSDIHTESLINAEYNILCKHDESKTDPEEYDAYDKYFYGGNKSYEVVQNFNYAWLHHIHNNPHHWQYWILNNDDPDKGEIILDMPEEYIIEMICDWWSFSWKQGKLEEIFKWYDERKDYIKLSENTRKMVQDLLDMIYEKLKQIEEEKNNETRNN